jgi:pimeloyl-ACP methyl ester carboxylesterase
MPSVLPQTDLVHDSSSAQVRGLLPAYFHNPRFQPSADMLRISGRHSVFLATSAQSLSAYDLRPALTRLRLPILILTGAADPFGTAWTADLRSALAASRPKMVTLPECGHFWQERPEMVLPLLDHFWSGSV